MTPFGSHGGTNRNFTATRSYRQSQHSVNTDQRQYASQGRKSDHELHGEGPRGERIAADLIEGFHVFYGDGGVDRTQLTLDRGENKMRVVGRTDDEVFENARACQKHK